MKKILLLTLLIFLLSGCTEQAIPAQNIVPPPTETTPLYEQSSKSIIVLSYPASDLLSLNRVTLEISGLGNSLAFSAATSLLSGKGGENYYVPFNGIASLTKIAVSRNVAKIYIKGDFSQLNGKEYFSSIVSLANTITELDGIDYIKLYINGEDFLPLGVFTNPLVHMDADLYTLYLKHQDYLSNNIDNLENTDSKNLLYFTDLSGKFLLAEVRTGSQTGENKAIDLLNQLKSGPSASDEMKSTIPKNVIMQSDPQVHEDPKNGTILTISLEVPKHEAIDNDARYMLAASIVSTMQSNIPEIDAVRLYINAQPAISTLLMKESDFDDILGNIATLYFPNEDSSYLIPINRAMSQYDFKLPSSRVRELIIGILPNETDSAIDIFPKGIDTDDLLAVSVSGDIAYVDFSLYLKRACNYDAAKESIFIYSIVNTLTELKNIKKVQILIDGEIQDSLCGHLSIEQPLMANPGIIQR